MALKQKLFGLQARGRYIDLDGTYHQSSKCLFADPRKALEFIPTWRKILIEGLQNSIYRLEPNELNIDVIDYELHE